MSDTSEQKRLQELSIKRKEMSVQQSRDLRQSEKILEKITTINTEPEPIDYAALTEKLKAEYAENEANAEARDGSNIRTVFDDIEQLKYDVNYRRLADFLGIEAKHIGDYAQELLIVMGWAVDNSKAPDLISALHAIKSLKKSLGYQEVGPTSLKKLYRYIRLDMDSHDISDRQIVKQINAEKELLKE